MKRFTFRSKVLKAALASFAFLATTSLLSQAALAKNFELYSKRVVAYPALEGSEVSQPASIYHYLNFEAVPNYDAANNFRYAVASVDTPTEQLDWKSDFRTYTIYDDNFPVGIRFSFTVTGPSYLYVKDLSAADPEASIERFALVDFNHLGYSLSSPYLGALSTHSSTIVFDAIDAQININVATTSNKIIPISFTSQAANSNLSRTQQVLLDFMGAENANQIQKGSPVQVRTRQFDSVVTLLPTDAKTNSSLTYTLAITRDPNFDLSQTTLDNSADQNKLVISYPLLISEGGDQSTQSMWLLLQRNNTEDGIPLRAGNYKSKLKFSVDLKEILV